MNKPTYVTDLEQCYGGPSQAAFGSAVFFDPRDSFASEVNLEQQALAKHQYFCGSTWDRFGEANWLQTWQQVDVRESDSTANIVAQLRSLDNSSARSSASQLLDNGPTGDSHQALAHAFDDASVSELRIFKLGDGQAMSGVLIAAQRPEGLLYLVFLMD